MEKISAACALSWNIELEKGLRSRKRGRPVESIRHIGPRLKRWCSEPQLTLGICNMFGLDPGEDRLFADAILFRLADAFVSGDKFIRIAIINVFLSTLKHCKTKDGCTCGILSNMSAENRLELLRRVEVVLYADCVESKALTFILFGCWAQIAVDVSEIQHAILSTLTSCHVLEVKASLFAAGCFSKLSDDFGSIFLVRLLNFMASPKTLQALRISGARSFRKIGCSLLLVIKSYKAGAELAKKIMEDDVLASMLISLTKCSLKAGILISEQVSLLSSFLSRETSPTIQSAILRCMHFIGEKSACIGPARTSLTQSLLRMLDEPNIPVALHSEVYQIIAKMVSYGLPDILLEDISGLMKLLRHAENAARSPILSERCIALEALIYISTKLKGRTETMSEFDPVSFSSWVATTVIDQVAGLLNPLSGGTSSSAEETELRSMLKLLLMLVEGHSELGFFILDKLYLFFEKLLESRDLSAADAHNSDIHKVVDAGAKEQILSTRTMMFNIHKFLVAFLEMLNNVGAATEQVVGKSKHLISLVCGNSFFDCTTHTLYALIRCSLANWSCTSSENINSSRSFQDLCSSPHKLPECEMAIHKCANNMLTGGDNWCAYKSGKYASCEGAWDVANSIFHHLETMVQSDICCKWLRFLAHFSHFESNVKVLLHGIFPCLSDCELNQCDVENGRRTTFSGEYIEKLVSVCDGISCSDKMLATTSVQTQTFYFQRWFLALRLKFLGILMDLLKLLAKYLCPKDYIKHLPESNVTKGNYLFHNMKDMISYLNAVSLRFGSLGEEFDLATLSFADMDRRSIKVMLDFSLCCSMLALCTEFINSIALWHVTKSQGDHLNFTVEDVVRRFWRTDSELCMRLLTLLKDNGLHERSSHLLHGFQMSNVGCTSNDLLTIFRSSVRRILEFQQCLGVLDEDTILEVYNDGVQFLLNVVEAWTQIPFRVPKYFFRVRHSIGSLLFWSSPGSRKQREVFVSSGCHLALNLCLQLKDVHSDIYSRFSKIYCILYCSISSVFRPSEESSAETWASYQTSQTDTIIHLNKKLQCYVMKQTREYKDLRDRGEVVEAFLCFETNGTTQGFSTGVLDVSAFPVGSYRIHWHSGSVDHCGAYLSFLPLGPGPLFTVR